MASASRRLPPLPKISEIIQLFNLSAKSQLSQNFLFDLNVTDKIVKVAGKVRDSCVCEVGPGPGSLTRSILNAGAKKVVVVEKDKRFISSLDLLKDASGDRLDVHWGDALNFDVAESCAPHVQKKEWHEEPPNLHILGNLPFNVSIPLLIRWLSMIPKRDGPFRFGRTQLTLTFQKEVAERIVAKINQHQRTRPSIMTQHLCQIKWGFLIRSKSFVPQPKVRKEIEVEAVVLKLTPLVTPLVDVDFESFEKVVRSMYHCRNKFVRFGTMQLFPGKSPKEQKILATDLLEQSGVIWSKRAHELTVEQFGAVTKNYIALMKNN